MVYNGYTRSKYTEHNTHMKEFTEWDPTNKNTFPVNFTEFMQEMQIYRAAIKEIQTKLEILDTEFEVKYDYNPIHHIESRLKTPSSIFGKLKKDQKPLTIEAMREYLNDIAGVRVICNYIDDARRIAEMLIAQDDITLIRKKDFISEPKENGYRSLHLVLSIPIYLAGGRQNVRVEVQIRTIAMDLWASLEHHLHYKGDEALSSELTERLKACADTLQNIDDEMQEIYRDIKGCKEYSKVHYMIR